MTPTRAPQSPAQAQHRLVELLQAFRTAMLITTSPDGAMNARPTAISQVDDDGSVWLLTEQQRVLELHPTVLIVCQGPGVHVRLAGRAEVVLEHAELTELAQSVSSTWAQGPTKLSLVRVTPQDGEYWDRSGVQGLEALLTAARHFVAEQHRLPVS